METTPRHCWTCQDDLAVLHLKLLHGEAVTPRHPDVVALSKVMKDSKGIKPSEVSIWMRKKNFDFLEGSDTNPRFSHAAERYTRKIWRQFQEDPGRISEKARKAFRKLTGAREPR